MLYYLLLDDILYLNNNRKGNKFKMTNTKKNIDMHYKVTDLENKLMDIEYPMLTNDDLDRQIKIIYNCIQTIKVLIENNAVDHDGGR